MKRLVFSSCFYSYYFFKWGYKLVQSPREYGSSSNIEQYDEIIGLLLSLLLLLLRRLL